MIRISFYLASAAFGAGLGAQAPPQTNGGDAAGAFQFAPPQRLTVGDAFLGQDRIYPSPVLHDVDGDGRAELVLGDLRGVLTVTTRKAAGASTAWDATAPLPGPGGAGLKFDNW